MCVLFIFKPSHNCITSFQITAEFNHGKFSESKCSVPYKEMSRHFVIIHQHHNHWNKRRNKKKRHRLECITWRNLWLHTPIKAINVYTVIQCHSVVNTSHNHKNIENESRQHNFGHTNISTHYTRAAGYLFAFYYLNLSVFFEIFSGLFFLRQDFHHFFVFVFLYNLVFITFALATFNKRT